MIKGSQFITSCGRFPVPITMHCIGIVESMAVLMYLAGESRLIVPHGKVKIHTNALGIPWRQRRS